MVQFQIQKFQNKKKQTKKKREGLIGICNTEELAHPIERQYAERWVTGSIPGGSQQ